MKQLDKIEKLQQEVALKRQQLKRSITIMTIWPDAFEQGSVTTQVTGNPRKQLTFTLTMGDGEKRTKPLEEVPTVLWPASVKADVLKLGPFACRKYFDLLKGEDANGSTS